MEFLFKHEESPEIPNQESVIQHESQSLMVPSIQVATDKNDFLTGFLIKDIKLNLFIFIKKTKEE